MNPENRFRLVGILALAGLISYAVLSGAPTASEAPTDTIEQALGDNS